MAWLIMGQEKIENKPNFNLGKINTSYYLTSEYERFSVFLFFIEAKNKANCN
jgi:hypothetical protein